MKITVLYTFDQTSSNNSNAVIMLEASIISVITELGNNADIYLYSTTPGSFEHLKYLGINIVKYNYLEFNQVTVRDFQDSLKHFNYIGHSRIYLIPYLLRKLQQPVLYMDNDTGIVISKGKTLIDYINKCTYPVGYCIEKWMPLEKLMRLYSKIKLSNDITYAGKVLRLTDCIINNGLLLYPNTETAYGFALEQINVYNYLQKTLYSHFNDMLSFTLMWYNTPNMTTFINPNKKYYINNLIQPMVIHYYYYKDKFKMVYAIINNFVTNYRINKKPIYLNINLNTIPNDVHWLTNLFIEYNIEDFKKHPTILEALE